MVKSYVEHDSLIGEDSKDVVWKNVRNGILMHLRTEIDVSEIIIVRRLLVKITVRKKIGWWRILRIRRREIWVVVASFSIAVNIMIWERGMNRERVIGPDKEESG